MDDFVLMFIPLGVMPTAAWRHHQMPEKEMPDTAPKLFCDFLIGKKQQFMIRNIPSTKTLNLPEYTTCTKSQCGVKRHASHMLLSIFMGGYRAPWLVLASVIADDFITLFSPM